MMAPYFLANYFIALVIFCLVGGYVLAALILAPFGRTIHLKIVDVCAALLAAEYLYSEGRNWIRGADFRYSFDGATVYVTDRGPIEFEQVERSDLLETSFGDGADLHRIGFEIEGAAETVRNYSDLYRHCPSVPSDHELEEFIDAKGAGRCPNVRPGGTRYFRSTNTPAVHLDCPPIRAGKHQPDGAKFCRMRFTHGQFDVRVVMWETPRSLWARTRDHVIAILDQSFRVEFDG
ncbi:hypothetical protein [Defluviimonas sp. SAOS-178_SWC]|uniref:hypothetical protein n=1 Tax=Defluviimonas sp. SAOS-178_SWC TaxID=3121287 RepID=UPI00322174A9